VGKRTSRKIDPRKTWGCYVLDLRKNFDWAGEISFASRLEGPKKYQDYDVSSNATIEIRAPLAYSDSNKVEIGIEVELTIYMEPEVGNAEFIGGLNKYSGGLSIYTWMPWHDAMFFHQVLMSGRCEMLEVFGTDVAV
jgi:hypothetical protein